MTDNINNNMSTGSTMLNVDITRYLQQQYLTDSKLVKRY